MKFALLVDNNSDLVDVVAALLEWMGHQCSCVATGAGALAFVADRYIDVAFIDVGLPDMCGFALAHAIRRCVRQQPYLVAMTRRTHYAHRDRAIDAGFDAQIVKPLDVATLERIVDASRQPPVAHALALVR